MNIYSDITKSYIISKAHIAVYKVIKPNAPAWPGMHWMRLVSRDWLCHFLLGYVYV